MPSDLDQAVLSLIPPKEALLPDLQRKVCALVLSQKGTSQLGIKICRDQGSLCCSSLLKKLFKLVMVSQMGWSQLFLHESTRKSRDLAKEPLRWAVTGHAHCVVELWDHIGQGLSDALCTGHFHVIHVDLDGAPQGDVSALDQGKSMGLSWSHNVLDGMLSCPSVHLLANPAASFVRTEALWKTKVSDPGTLKPMYEMISTFTMKYRGNSVLGGLVNDTEHWELLLTGIALDPQHISLQAFTNFSNLMSKSRWCNLIWALVAQASSALKVASCLNDLVASSTALQEFDKCLRLGVAQVAMQSLHSANCFGLQCRLELDQASSDLLLLRDGEAIVPKLSRVRSTESSCNRRCKARLIVLQV